MEKGKTSRRVKQGAVDIDYENTALVVNYDIEVVRKFISQSNFSLMKSLKTKGPCRRKWTSVGST